MSKISDLAAATGTEVADGDLFEVVDVSDTSLAATGTNKKITRSELLNAVSSPASRLYMAANYR